MCINNGKVSLKELVVFFSFVFNTSLPHFHSVIKRMADRKSDPIHMESRSFFLNELIVKFNEKLVHLDEN
jgi:RteC protein